MIQCPQFCVVVNVSRCQPASRVQRPPTSLRDRSVTLLHCQPKGKEQARHTFQRLSLSSFALLVATGACVCVVLSPCRVVLLLFALLLIRGGAGGVVRAEAVYLQCCMFAAELELR